MQLLIYIILLKFQFLSDNRQARLVFQGRTASHEGWDDL